MTRNALRTMVLADVAANTLAIGLLILLMVTLAPQSRPATDGVPDPDAPMKAEDEFRLFQRRPLLPEQMVMSLFSRAHQNTSDRILVDIFGDSVALVAPGYNPAQARVLKSDEAGFSQGLADFFSRHDNSNAVYVYVFDNRNYYAVRDRLEGSRHNWTELTVPQALRSAAETGDEQAWSSGFSRIIGRVFDRDAFREQLIMLLAQSARNGSTVRHASVGGYFEDAPGEGTTGQSGETTRRRGILERLLDLLKVAVFWCSVAGGIGFVGYIELSKRFNPARLSRGR